MSKCENCGNEHIEIITKEVGYVCGKCGRNTVELAKQHITNGDRIRSMTDEELAVFLPIVFDCMCNHIDKCREVVINHGECTKTTECALKWLQSEVEDNRC